LTPAKVPRGIVVGASSDIGLAISRDWLDKGISIIGSYRTHSTALSDIACRFEALLPCDFADPPSIVRFADSIASRKHSWDYLIICPGTMEPIGNFAEVDMEAWCEGFSVNFLASMRVLHALLPLRAHDSPFVGLFAGGGTNSAPKAFSAYTLAKIALIKAVELIDAEVADLRISILGPGWVQTKIHDETLRCQAKAPEAFAETSRRLKKRDFHPLTRVVECVAWAMAAPKEVVSGRNFSVVHDSWGSDSLTQRLLDDFDMYKLRRANNQRLDTP
jgi:NAD(P)-dependent dehydrogenase (short-subunit alcohol dehydrogenase family)